MNNTDILQRIFPFSISSFPNNNNNNNNIDADIKFHFKHILTRIFSLASVTTTWDRILLHQSEQEKHKSLSSQHPSMRFFIFVEDGISKKAQLIDPILRRFLDRNHNINNNNNSTIGSRLYKFILRLYLHSVGESEDEDPTEKLSKLKLNRQLRVLSPDKKFLAVGVGKDLYLYRHSASKRQLHQQHHFFFDFIELASVKPKRTGEPTTNVIPSSLSQDDTTTLSTHSASASSSSSSSGVKMRAYRSVFSNSSSSLLLSVSCLDGSIRFGDPQKTGQLMGSLQIGEEEEEQDQKRQSSSIAQHHLHERFFIEAMSFSKDDQYLYFCAGSVVYVAKLFSCCMTATSTTKLFDPHIVVNWKMDLVAKQRQNNRKSLNNIIINNGASYINNLRVLDPVISPLSDDFSPKHSAVDERLHLLAVCVDSYILLYDISPSKRREEEEEKPEPPKLFKKINVGSFVVYPSIGEEHDDVTVVVDCLLLRSGDDYDGNSHPPQEQQHVIVALTKSGTLISIDLHIKSETDVYVRESPNKRPLSTEHSGTVFSFSVAAVQHKQTQKGITNNNTLLLATGSKEDGDIRLFDFNSWKQHKRLLLRGEGPGLLTCFIFICGAASFSTNNRKLKQHQQQQPLQQSFWNESTFCLASGYHSNVAKIWTIHMSRDFEHHDNYSQCLRVINFDSSVLSVASSFFSTTRTDNYNDNADVDDDREESHSSSSSLLVFTDYYGSRRFFGIVKYQRDNNPNSKLQNDEKVNRKIKSSNEYPIVRIEFARVDDNNDDALPQVYCEDLVGNRF